MDSCLVAWVHDLKSHDAKSDNSRRSGSKMQIVEFSVRHYIASYEPNKNFFPVPYL